MAFCQRGKSEENCAEEKIVTFANFTSLIVQEVVRLKRFIYLLGAIVLLSACATNQNAVSDKAPGAEEALYPTEAADWEGDFVYKLFTEKDIYDELRDVAVIAELTYIGDKESIKIYHGGSPFFFPLEERTHGNKIDYAVTQQLIVRTLQKDVPYREKHTFPDENKEYVDHIRAIMHEGFPKGDYVIRGLAQFDIKNPSEAIDEDKFNMEADIGFTVKDGVNE